MCIPKRQTFSAKQRQNVYEKLNGHCAYCGCEIKIFEMQIDHLQPIAHGGTNDIENFMPACRSCNTYKSVLSVEKFRQQLENQPNVLARDSATYRIAVRFGTVVPNPCRISFYYEKNIDLNSIPGLSADYKKNVYWEKEGKKIWQDTHTKEFHWDGLTRGEEIELIGNGLWEWIRRYRGGGE